MAAAGGGPKEVAPAPIKPKAGLFGADRLFKGIGPRPGLDAGGVFKGLPDRGGEKAGLWAVLAKQAEEREAKQAADAVKLKPGVRLGLDLFPGFAKGLKDVKPRSRWRCSRPARR